MLRAFTLQSGAISCVFYLLGLVFSLAIAADDNRISLYKEDPTLWEDVDVGHFSISANLKFESFVLHLNITERIIQIYSFKPCNLHNKT